MNNEEKRSEFETLLQQRLTSSEELSAEQRQQLNRIRNKVLSAHSKPHWMQLLLRRNLWATSACSLLLVVGLVSLVIPSAPPISNHDELSLLMDTDSLDLYDNLEFYQWLDEAELNQG